MSTMLATKKSNKILHCNSSTFFSAQHHHEEQQRQKEHALTAAARGLFWTICSLGTGCIKLIAHTAQLGNLSFFLLAKLLLKILNTNSQGQTSVEVLDAYFHFDNESLITSLSCSFRLFYTLLMVIILMVIIKCFLYFFTRISCKTLPKA